MEQVQHIDESVSFQVTKRGALIIWDPTLSAPLWLFTDALLSQQNFSACREW
jgi:hypothetical protein